MNADGWPKNLSLGVQGDYVVNHHEAEMRTLDGAVAVITASNQDYYFGNYLALTSPINTRSKNEWERMFDLAFADLTKIRHRTFIGSKADMSDSVIQDFQAAGYRYEEEDILVLAEQELCQLPVGLDARIEIRPFTKASDWQQSLEISVALREAGIDEQGYLEYRLGRQTSYQALNAKNLGNFFGAFANGDLVGYAGVFHWQGVARYQDVRVVPVWQNKGIARQLIYQMAKTVAPLVKQQIIIADTNYHATRLYQSLGFRLAEQEASLCYWPGLPGAKD